MIFYPFVHERNTIRKAVRGKIATTAFARPDTVMCRPLIGSGGRSCPPTYCSPHVQKIDRKSRASLQAITPESGRSAIHRKS